MPFSVPEGYFESFTGKVFGRIAAETAGGSGVKPVTSVRFVRNFAIAAAIAVLVALGITFSLGLRNTVSPEGGVLDDDDYIFYYTELVPVTESDYVYYSYNYSANEEITGEDIINYLYYSDAEGDEFLNE